MTPSNIATSGPCAIGAGPRRSRPHGRVAPMVEKLDAGRYYGQEQGSREVAGLTFSESVYPPEFAIPAHRHEHAFFYLIIAGHCSEVSGQRDDSGGPPSLVFHPPGEVHANRWHGAGGRCFH